MLFVSQHAVLAGQRVSVFYFCPATPKPTGGIKQIHRHVEALAQSGVDAHVLVGAATRPAWFDTTAPMASLPQPRLQALWAQLRREQTDDLWWLRTTQGPMVTIDRADGLPLRRRLGSDDILVLPEYYGKKLARCAFGARVVVFNQNAHYMFQHFEPGEAVDDFVYCAGAMGVLAVSEHIVEYLRHAFPGLLVLLTRNGIDTNHFHARVPKKRQIAFMPRKGARDIVQVLQILRIRGLLEGWTLKAIDDMNEADVAAAMRESAIFLSTCEAEGFGLPPLEAAACGCIVVGYHGQAAREFMLPEYCYPVEQGDVLTYAITVERLIREYELDPTPLIERARRHAAFVRERYSREAEAEGVVRAWGDLLRAAPAACPPARDGQPGPATMLTAS